MPFLTLTAALKAARSQLAVEAGLVVSRRSLVRLRLSTKAIKTLTHKGLEAMAKEAGINLSRH
jgi:ribosomal protein L28